MRGCLAAPRRGQAATNILCCGSVQSQVIRFRHFVRKITTVNPIPVLFSPTRSTQLILSYFSVKSYFHILETAYPIITYFPKTLKNHFYSKSQFSPKRFLITKQQPKTENHYTITHHNQLVSFIKNHQHHNST